MKIGERIRAATDSIGPAALWIMVAVAAIVAAFGAFLATDLSGSLIFDPHPNFKTQTPWLFVVAMTIAVASGANALLRTSETMWRSWLLRIGMPVVLLAVIIFLVADAQASAPEYLFLTDDGVIARPAFPYARAVFAAFSLVGQFALLVRLRGRDS